MGLFDSAKTLGEFAQFLANPKSKLVFDDTNPIHQLLAKLSNTARDIRYASLKTFKGDIECYKLEFKANRNIDKRQWVINVTTPNRAEYERVRKVATTLKIIQTKDPDTDKEDMKKRLVSINVWAATNGIPF